MKSIASSKVDHIKRRGNWEHSWPSSVNNVCPSPNAPSKQSKQKLFVQHCVNVACNESFQVITNTGNCGGSYA